MIIKCCIYVFSDMEWWKIQRTIYTTKIEFNAIWLSNKYNNWLAHYSIEYYHNMLIHEIISIIIFIYFDYISIIPLKEMQVTFSHFLHMRIFKMLSTIRNPISPSFPRLKYLKNLKISVSPCEVYEEWFTYHLSFFCYQLISTSFSGKSKSIRYSYMEKDLFRILSLWEIIKAISGKKFSPSNEKKNISGFPLCLETQRHHKFYPNSHLPI